MLQIRPTRFLSAACADNRARYQPLICNVFLGAALAAAGAFGPVAAAADLGDRPVAIEWQCQQQYDESYHVRCNAHSAQPAATAPSAVRVSTEVPAASTLQRVDMRAVALRGAHEIFSPQGWSVPLYTRPTDAQGVTQLLTSVLCDTAPRCTVTYGPGGARSAEN